ncbi:MAG: FliM/FliN family flagellar motor switch protein [Solirubrobacterales bacterium]
MNPSMDQLNKTRIRRLLAAMGTVSAPEPPAANVIPYDWRDPHYLNADQFNRLAAVMSQTAARMAGVLARFFSHEFDVSPTAVSQHFAGDLHRVFEPNDGYSQTFGPDKGPSCGFFAVSSQATTDWVSRLLGDAGAGGDSHRSLSALEESLLSDLVTAVLDAFLDPLRSHESLKGDGRLSKGQPSVRFEPTEEICRIAFQIKEAGKDQAFDLTFVVPCSKLAPLVGKTSATASRLTPQELSQALMAHIHQMPVNVTARLATIDVSLPEILELGCGDVLLLGKPIDAMIELAVEGCVLFRGRPANSSGQHAIYIQEGPPKKEEPRAAAQPQAASPAPSQAPAQPQASPPAGRGQETPTPKSKNEHKKG